MIDETRKRNDDDDIDTSPIFFSHNSFSSLERIESLELLLVEKIRREEHGAVVP